MLFGLGLISFGVWGYTVLYSPYSIATLFFPQPEPQAGLVLHTRKALQADEVGLCVATFLWLVYSFLDLYIADLVGVPSLLLAMVLPIVAVCMGPGATFVLGWYARERVFDSIKKD